MLHWQRHVRRTSGSPTTDFICGGLTGDPLTLVQAARSRSMNQVRHHYTRSLGSFALAAAVAGARA